MKSRPRVSLRLLKQYELRAFSHRFPTEEVWVLEAEGERCDDVPRMPQSILHWWGANFHLDFTCVFADRGEIADASFREQGRHRNVAPTSADVNLAPRSQLFGKWRL
jgi:hypothetical protein